MFLQTKSWVCAHELNHIWDKCPIYLCASHFPCNCVDKTLAGWGVSACVCVCVCQLRHLVTAFHFKLTERSIKGNCKQHQCAVFGSPIKLVLGKKWYV